jgi:hypothetical protein
VVTRVRAVLGIGSPLPGCRLQNGSHDKTACLYRAVSSDAKRLCQVPINPLRPSGNYMYHLI